jgi:hypothetical protein
VKRTGLRRRWLALALAALAPAGAVAQEPSMAFDGKVASYCGGVGAEERAAMKGLEPQANVRLAFVTARRGGYLADAALRVEEGKSEVFRVTADGPFCLLRLPPGTYRFTAELGGVRRTAQLAVPAMVGRPATLAFAFPGEAWDGIWASDEEKRQARE